MILRDTRGQDKQLRFQSRWTADDHGQVSAALRKPGGDGHVVGRISVRWRTWAEGVISLKLPFRLTRTDSVDPSTIVDEVDIEIDSPAFETRVAVLHAHPRTSSGHWELNVHPRDTRWLSLVMLFPEEIPTAHDLTG
jgi:hypothetical protein